MKDGLRIITSTEMRAAEQNAFQHGLLYDTMMERAGLAVADVISGHVTPQQGNVVVLVGPGNNGGDGLVAARHLLQRGYTVHCYALTKRGPDDLNTARLTALGVIPTCTADDTNLVALDKMLYGSSAVVDALFGTGMHGPLRGEAPRILGQVARYMASPEGANRTITSMTPQTRSRRPLVFAVDLPSGLDADTGTVDASALQADFTITFGFPKYGHFLLPGGPTSGMLYIADIGLTDVPEGAAPVYTATPELIRRWLPERPPAGNKGTFGTALVIGGSLAYSGAPRLAAEAAYRAGSGLVSLAIPEGLYTSISAQLPDATYCVLPGDPHFISRQAYAALPDLERHSALLVGPGLGTHEQTGAFLGDLLQVNCNAVTTHSASLPPTVIDADGLNLLTRITGWWEYLPADCVLTPHPGEMARLCALSVQQVQADRWRLAREMAKKWRCTVVLKGAYTVCASSQGEETVIPFANPLLATAGTGDVLAGTITGLLAQRIPPYHAAVCGAFLHGLAGEYKRCEIGSSGMLAHELPALIAQAANNVRQGK